MIRSLGVNINPINTVLKRGEAGFYGGVFKIGDGVKTWGQLSQIDFGFNRLAVPYLSQWFEFKTQKINLAMAQGQKNGAAVAVHIELENPHNVNYLIDIEHVFKTDSDPNGNGLFLNYSYSAIAAAGIRAPQLFHQEYFLTYSKTVAPRGFTTELTVNILAIK